MLMIAGLGNWPSRTKGTVKILQNQQLRFLSMIQISCMSIYRFKYEIMLGNPVKSSLWIFKQLIVPKRIQITNERPEYILPLVNCNVYWPLIGHLHCLTSFFIGFTNLYWWKSSWCQTVCLSIIFFFYNRLYFISPILSFFSVSNASHNSF